jgi:hypothetical protein
MAVKTRALARERGSLAAMSRRSQSARLHEAWIVWVLFGLTAAAVFATYWRLPPRVLWKVHNSGLVGGAGRAFVFLSFSAALAAVAALPIVVDRLEDRRADLAGIVAFVLCATVAYPGVQTESHLDPKWSNLPAVAGVALAVALTLWATRRGRRERPRTTLAGDRARLAVGLVSLVFAAPYIAAELGFFLDGVPVLGSIFQTGKIVPEPGAGYSHPAVHHGHHHGMDGALLVWSALALSRVAGQRRLLGAYLALMLAYGLGEVANDFWLEQVVKRGWTAWSIPDVTRPSLSVAWGLIVLGACAAYAASRSTSSSAATGSVT